jgi:hypothetical protein
MKQLGILLLICSSTMYCGPLALLTTVVTNPVVQGGMAGALGSRLLGGGQRGYDPSEAMLSLVRSAEHCAVENGNLREAVGVLRERQRDYTTTKQDLRNSEQENRQLFSAHVQLSVDNRFKQEQIERLRNKQQRLATQNTHLKQELSTTAQQQQQLAQAHQEQRQIINGLAAQVEVPKAAWHMLPDSARTVFKAAEEPRDLNHLQTSALPMGKALAAIAGTTCFCMAVTAVQAKKINVLEQRIKKSALIHWEPEHITRSPKELAQSLVDTFIHRLGPLSPDRAIAQLQHEISKCVLLLQRYLSWKTWQSSIFGQFLGLEEEKFQQCEAYLNKMLIIQAGLNSKGIFPSTIPSPRKD